MTNAAGIADELGDHLGAVPAFREALRWWEATGNPASDGLRAGALINLSQALQHLGDLDAAQTALESARKIILDAAPSPGVDHAELMLSCLVSLTAVARHQRRLSDAGELARQSLEVAGRIAPHRTGYPLMNLAAVHEETGQWDLAQDFAHQALAAFEAAGDRVAVAENQLSLAIMYIRWNRFADAEAQLVPAQRFFNAAGMDHYLAMCTKMSAYLLASAGEHSRANELFHRSRSLFENTGAVVEAAEVRLSLALVAAAQGRYLDAEGLHDEAYAVYAERGLSLACAQLDFRRALFLEQQAVAQPHSAATLLPRALDLAIPAALAIDAVRFTLTDGRRRAQWQRIVAEPAWELAFRLAATVGDVRLVAELVETQCAGTPLAGTGTPEAIEPVLPMALLDATPPSDRGPADADATRQAGAFHLGAALADYAAGFGLAVAPPPRLAMTPSNVVALAHHLGMAEDRYGVEIREARVIPTW